MSVWPGGSWDEYITSYVPQDELTRRGLSYGDVFVQNAWRRVIDGIPEGYIPVQYPKWQYHPTLPACIVETLVEHERLYASDPRWYDPPGDNLLLAAFLRELA